ASRKHHLGEGLTMMRLYLTLLCGVVLAFAMGASAAASGTTRHVSPTGSDTGNCTVSPCRTIQYAVNQANSGDTVSVAAGTYNESVSVTKRLSLVGSGATIDAAGESTPPNGVVVSGSSAAGTAIHGFTVENAGL